MMRKTFVLALAQTLFLASLILAGALVAAGSPALAAPVGSPAPAARAAALTLPNGMCADGDSWTALVYYDAAQTGYNSANLLNQANAAIGHRFEWVGDYGISGQRSDEYLVRLPSALGNAQCKWVWIRGVVNDIGAAGTGAFSATANQVWFGYINTNRGNPQTSLGLKAAYDAVLASGKSLLLTSEPGQTNWTAAQIAQRDLFNEYQREYARTHPGVVYLDINQAILNPTATTFAFQTNYSLDGTHLGTLGAFAAGQAIAAQLAVMFPPVDALPSSVLETTGGSNQITNGLFTTTSGGVAGTGASGTVPSGWNVSCSSGATATVSTQADPNGFGNSLHLVMNFTATGQTCQAVWAITPGTAISGAMWRAGAKVSVAAGSSNLCGPLLQWLFQYTPTGGSKLNYGGFDMYADQTRGAGPTTAYTETLQTKTLAIPASYGVGNVWDILVQFPSAGAGSATADITRAYGRQVYQ